MSGMLARNQRSSDALKSDEQFETENVSESHSVSYLHWSRVEHYGDIKPPKLRAHTMNLVGEHLLIFGGSSLEACTNDVYFFNVYTLYWHQAKTTGGPPDPCRAHSSVTVGHKVYYFGGGDGPNYFNTLYCLDTETLRWDKPAIKGDPPSARRAQSMWYYKNHIYIYAGGDGARALDDIFCINISEPGPWQWTPLFTRGPGVPKARGYHASTLVGSKVVVLNGSDGSECFDDIYVLDLDTRVWYSIETTGEKRMQLLSHSSTKVGNYLFVFGGHDGGCYNSALWELNLMTMTIEKRKVLGRPPSPRGYHTAEYVDGRMFIFGGFDGQQVFNDMWVLDLSGAAYLATQENYQTSMSASPNGSDRRHLSHLQSPTL